MRFQNATFDSHNLLELTPRQNINAFAESKRKLSLHLFSGSSQQQFELAIYWLIPIVILYRISPLHRKTFSVFANTRRKKKTIKTGRASRSGNRMYRYCSINETNKIIENDLAWGELFLVLLLYRNDFWYFVSFFT